MSFATNMLKELRERKLWPLAIGLIVALVAVPVLLSKKASTNLVTPPVGAGLPYSTGTALPAITVETAAGGSKLAGRARNPFTPQIVATTSTPTSTTPTPAAGTGAGSATGGAGTVGSSGTSAGGASTGAGGGSTAGGSTATTPAATPPSTPAPTAPAKPTTPKPAPSGLTPTQTYQVSLAITAPNGGLNTIDPLERLSVLPSVRTPLLVELGVLQGGRQVLFAVEPGAAVSGPGACTPGPIDCEVLSLAPGQTEGVSQQAGTGTTPVAEFQVASISAADHPSVAEADQARRVASDAGRQLLANSPLSTGSLFQYDSSVGAVVDLRNLTVGGN
jgi:hypothetical protein